jgi:type IV secretory pathway VirB10-like protein
MEQPHFDDELTTLTARPVIPLEEIDAKVKHKRRWFLGGAFVMAMLLGAASALVSAYFKFRNIPDAEIQSLSVVEPEAVAEPAFETPSPAVETVEFVPERPQPKPRNPDKTDRTERMTQPVIEPRLNEDDELRRIRDDVLTDRWEERRARRVARRERRRAQHRDRDLSNIDEIFEGPHRP